jgi:hypothetical protein
VRSENFTLLAITAHKFGCRPSSLVGLADPVLALDFDLAAAGRLLDMQRSAVAEIEDGAGDQTPAPVQANHIYW